MLKNDFYTVHDPEPGNNSLVCRIIFNAGHDIFKGHFPQQPVVPGVCMMQIVKELLEEQTGKKLFLQQAPQVKFLQLTLPETEPEITINWSADGDLFSVNAVFKKEGTALFKMNGTLKIER